MQVIPHNNTQNAMNLSLSRTRNVNNNTLFMNNLVYSKKMENGAEHLEKNSIIEVTMDNKKSRNTNNNTVFNKPSDFIAKTNIYVKKSIDNKIIGNSRDKKSKILNIMRTQKPIYSNNNESSISIKNLIAGPRILNYSTQIKQNLISKLTGSSVNGKKVIYVEKTEINLQKSDNTSKSNITSQNETSLTKSVNLITPSKQSTYKSSSTKALDKSFNSQGIDLYKYISSLLQNKISRHTQHSNSKAKSEVKKLIPPKNNFNSSFMGKGSNARKNQHISYEVNLNSNQRKPNDNLQSNEQKKKSRNISYNIKKHNTDKTPSVKSISYYIQNKRKKVLLEETSMVRNIKESSQNSIIKNTSNKKEKIVENSFLKKSANPLTSSNPPSQNSNNGNDRIIPSNF